MAGQYEDLSKLLGQKNVVEAADRQTVGAVGKSPFVEKADEQKPPLPQGAVPAASVPGAAPAFILKAIIYSDYGNNVAVIKDDKSEKTVTVNSDTALGKITEIGRDYIVVNGRVLSISGR